MADDDKDNNEALMTKFIEGATPKLLEALQEQIAPLVEKQIGGLVENSTKMLDQLKKAQTAQDEATKKVGEDALQLKNLLAQNADAKTTLDALKPEPIQITRAQARDVQLYRRAKAQAEAQGTSVQFIESE